MVKEIFNETDILEQLMIKNRDELKQIISQGSFLVNSIDFCEGHNYYELSLENLTTTGCIVLKKSCEKNIDCCIKGEKAEIRRRIEKLVNDKRFLEFSKRCHRGHLIAKQLKDYTEFSTFNFSKNNPSNIYPQWENANINRAYGTNIRGQAYFENEIIKWLQEGLELFYDVKPIFKEGQEDYPIGNVLLAFEREYVSLSDLTNDEKNKRFCVFIPNYLDIASLSR
ncbi:DNA/RNA non-specific endonuclease [Streptococcus ruminantium]|uniref:DNA/RNA non-specific endonuclease n=1 Tax=Streptococcus ruminantium TaxID=1917441 RepID=UPI0012DD3A80|nr:DNA/RNA non-specific endonuclease [Streptococcus ruminantium]